MFKLSLKIRLSVEPSATMSYVAGFLLISAYIWNRRRHLGWSPK